MDLRFERAFVFSVQSKISIMMIMHSFSVLLLLFHASSLVVCSTTSSNITEEMLHEIASSLKMFVDELPDMPKIKAYSFNQGAFTTAQLRIGMFEKKWKFHRDLPPTTVFAFGTSKAAATVPGPTIEALQGVETIVTWENHLPPRHILPLDPTLNIPHLRHGGIPTVVHLHGAIHEPESDGNPLAWFTAGFKETGPGWKKANYLYHNLQHAGNMWYHDHAIGMTRANLLAGLLGAYVIRNPSVESPLNLPSGPEYDRNLVVFDRSFTSDGSIYLNSSGIVPSVHPQWQPAYFGVAIIVNGKVWPYLKVKRTKYRFRIVNSSNARFYRFALSNGLQITQIGSDSAYLTRPVTLKNLLLAPSEIADIIIDFSNSSTGEAILTNSAPYPFPSGNAVDDLNSKVMKFVIEPTGCPTQIIPQKLIKYRRPIRKAARTRYITMYEYLTSTNLSTQLLLNGLPFDAPVTETPRQGTSELWYVINLTDENHPLHIHLGLFVVLHQIQLRKVDEFKDCMMKKNDALKCEVEKHAKGRAMRAPLNERGWKNVFKAKPGFVTSILLQFTFVDSHRPYPFNASAEPGYVYHCHILGHEDNDKMRPLKILP